MIFYYCGINKRMICSSYASLLVVAVKRQLRIRARLSMNPTLEQNTAVLPVVFFYFPLLCSHTSHIGPHLGHCFIREF